VKVKVKVKVKEAYKMVKSYPYKKENTYLYP